MFFLSAYVHAYPKMDAHARANQSHFRRPAMAGAARLLCLAALLTVAHAASYSYTVYNGVTGQLQNGYLFLSSSFLPLLRMALDFDLTFLSYSWGTSCDSTTNPAPGMSYSCAYPIETFPFDLDSLIDLITLHLPSSLRSLTGAIQASGGFAPHNFVGFDPRFYTTMTFWARAYASYVPM